MPVFKHLAVRGMAMRSSTGRLIVRVALCALAGAQPTSARRARPEAFCAASELAAHAPGGFCSNPKHFGQETVAVAESGSKAFNSP
jgi:hypothetical protein